jgi:hypothetical protein
MKKAMSIVLIALGTFELIYVFFVLPQINRNFAAAGVLEAKEAGTPWVAVAIGVLFVLGGVVMRPTKDERGAG